MAKHSNRFNRCNSPDSLDFSSDFATNAVVNVANKVIIGTTTYEYKENGLYVNGEKWEADAPGGTFASASTNQQMALFMFCNYCDTCRNWQREAKFSTPWLDDKGRTWKFYKIIAIRGISIDGRGHAKATIKTYRKVGNKYKRKRAWVTLRMQGTVWSNKCTQPTAFNSGLYSSSRPRNFFRRKYAAVANRFFRTKKMKMLGEYTIDPKGNGVPYGENLYLTW